ncbi:MAG TPA: hypothetical protein PLJ69_08745 [Methanothrix sp.]|jgi:hypothetical protein|nr:hypothetical protein [Methanothrix sp.]OPX80964.1 MAG: hypothetical protein A4E50_01296 [Methanosaeta sp. PtaB.Bin087]OPY51648.1 MAG: hypothetical protein A4E51_01499 [Methanosaeta sp. PtaU1.Bin055]HOI68453.1 hypothetical protein [Methanothrix sp.]HPY73256.1 hypothetical protein [Methanothrix sp.]
MRMKGFMTLLAALFVLTMAAAAGGMYQGVSGGPAMSYGGVSGSIDGIFASYPGAPSSFPGPLFMTGEEFCQFVAAHLANPPTAWRW